MVGKDHRLSLTATHKESNQRAHHAPTSLHNGSPYVHATGLANLHTSISQFHNYSTSTTLISPPLYRKTLQGIKHIIFSDLQVYVGFYD